VVRTEEFVRQFSALPRGLQVQAAHALDLLANAMDPARIAEPHPTGVEHVWRLHHDGVIVSAAVYDDTLRVDALTVRPNS